MNRWLAGIAIMTMTTWGFAADVPFVEDFALAKDRAAVLKQLIPGTEEYYYYHCLHYLNSEQYEKIEPLTKPWYERHGSTQRLLEIQTRHAFLAYEKDPQKSLAYLRGRIGLQYQHQKEVLGVAPNLPTQLDPQLIRRETLQARSLRDWSNLDNFEDRGLEAIAALDLTWEKRRNLLQRLQRPDIANLVTLIDEDLKSPHAPGFGAYPIHTRMTLKQLSELLKVRPSLLDHSGFVNVWVMKLQPHADMDWKRNANLTLQYLERLQAFTDRLSPVFNSLKAHVQYHRLAFDRARGELKKERFLAYLKLPRMQPYMPKALLESDEARRHPVDLNAEFSAATLLPRVGSDEALVRDALKQFLMAATSPREYEPYIHDVYLRHLFAEAKAENDLGDAEQWASQLPPELFRSLKDRIDIDFAPTNKTEFGADDDVSLDLFIKNVPSLLVKVFEINANQVYRTTQREIDTDMNLDGLVANAEQVHAYKEPPLRRMSRRFEFPSLKKPGIYIIDFIGAGKSSRALIRKGRLRPVVTLVPSGHKIRVVNELNKPVPEAVVWLGGTEYTPDETGVVTVPYSTAPSRQPIVIRAGNLASLDQLEHRGESYRLAVGLHVDRESLLTQRVANLLVRPGLFLNDIPMSVQLLQNVRLRITSSNQDKIPTTTDVSDFKLFEDRESTHEIRVPARLSSLTITLSCEVKNQTNGATVPLTESKTLTLNEIDQSERIEDLHFAQFGNDYVIELLGRTGEARMDRPVQLALKHRDFREAVNATLKTDRAGRVHLGPLTEIATITATGPEGTTHQWNPQAGQHTYRRAIHARAGEVVSVPYLGDREKPSREEFALFEVRGADIRTDFFDAIGFAAGRVELRSLPAGDYDFTLKTQGETIRIRIVDGPVVQGSVLGGLRHMQLPGLKPVAIRDLQTTDDEIVIRLSDTTKFTRLHLFATRYQPAYSAFRSLSQVRDAELAGVYPAQAVSTYLTGRNIGDEYRYVLDRRSQKKYPGNLLDRPQLLLNPWAIRTTDSGEQLAESGQAFGGRGGFDAPRSERGEPRAADAKNAVASPGFANLDFLSDASVVVANLVPDKDGVVRVPRKALAPRAMIHAVAVDPLSTTSRSFTLPEHPAKFLDLRLASGLDPAKHFTQQKQTKVLTPGQPITLADISNSRFELYDSLGKVHALFTTLNREAKLVEFAFILKWPTMKLEEKRSLYSKYASHELNFWIMRKDPEFFNAVVKPYLAHKKDATFLDHYLLDNDLRAFLKPWNYGRLNTVERVLLAQRTPGEPVKTQRHFTELLQMLPPRLDRELLLFETAVTNGTLGDGEFNRAQSERYRRSGQELPTLGVELGLAAKPADQPTAMPVPGLGGGGMGGAPGGAPGSGSGGRAAFGMPKAPAAAKSESRPAAEEAKLREQLGRGTRDGASRKNLSDDFALKQDAKGISDRRMAEEKAGMGAAENESFFEFDKKKQTLNRQLFRRLDATREWAENNYYHLPIAAQIADLITISPFWRDYAAHTGNGAFLSPHFADASRNFTEAMFALSVLDLPVESPQQAIKFDGGRMTLTPASPAIALHEEVRPAEPQPGPSPILVSQNFYRQGERYRQENGEQVDKFITGEFLAQVVYGCQIVVTNPTSTRQKLTSLIQLPLGAIPLNNGQFTRSVAMDLEPYRTQTIDYLFYFPLAGQFDQFPVHVGKGERFIAAAAPVRFTVVDRPTKLDTTSWDYISQNGTNEDVLGYLIRENVRSLNLDKVAFRLKDRGFYEALTKLLAERHQYHATTWSYSLLHADLPAAREYLQHEDAIVNECAGPLESPLLAIQPVVRHQYQHLEYRPLVNARAHTLGQRRQIVNGVLLQQYSTMLKNLSYQQQLSSDDRMAVTYYLMLQDRIEESLEWFGTVKLENLHTKLQYDYCSAYLSMYREDLASARSVAMKHANHPVDRWRNLFTALASQLDEVEGKKMQVVDKENREQKLGQLAATEPAFEFTLEQKAMQLSWQNLETVTVNYYLMDVELLFSRNPFVQQSHGQFSSIRPNATKVLKLPAAQGKSGFPVPDEFLKKNVLIEITAAGKTRSAAYYANVMDVKFTENYGQLKAADSDGTKPLSKVYVKVYARHADGTVKFHKDGYTDLRGRFDYATVSTPERLPIVRYSVLVLSDDRGATIRELAPPQQ